MPPGMIINPIIKHLLPTAPALPSFADPWGLNHTIAGSQRIGRGEGGLREEGESETERGIVGGVGKKSSDSGGSSDSQILSHQRGVIVQKDKRV